MAKYLHSMIRVTDPDATVAFFKLIGLEEVRRFDVEAGRFTLIFLAAPGQEGVAEVELTYNWPPEDGGSGEQYGGGRNFACNSGVGEDGKSRCGEYKGLLHFRSPAWM